MQKFVAVFVLFAVVALVATTGCVSEDDKQIAAIKAADRAYADSHKTVEEKQAALDASKPQAISGLHAEAGEYGWTIVSGTVENHENRDKDIAVYVDFYDVDGTKIDHVLDMVSVDAYGKAAFDATSTKGGVATYKAYIDHVY